MSRRWRIAAAVALVLVCTVGLAAWQVRRYVADSRERLAGLRQGALATDGSGAAAADQATLAGAATSPDTVRRACGQAQDLDRVFGPIVDLNGAVGPAAQLLGRLPQVGEQATEMLSLAAAGRDAVAAMRLACEVLEPLLDAQATGTDAAGLVERLSGSREQLREAAARLRSAHTRLDSIDGATLDEPTRRLMKSLRDRLPSLAARLVLLSEVPGLLGYEGPQTYLVLGQNRDELRPTGGFIGTSGTLTFDRGKVVQRKYGSSVALNVPPDRLVTPPEPLRRYMDAAYWQLSESNWAPDFPTAALQAQFFYGLVRPNQLAGVVAVNQNFVAMLLDVTGPVVVPGYGETISTENVRERMDYYVHRDEAWLEDEQTRKGFVSALLPLVLDRLNALPADRFKDLAGVLDQALTQQDLLIWSADDDAEQALAALGWSGAMIPASGDYLFPVSANVGMNKINREVAQELDYQVDRDEGGHLVGRASMRIANRRPTADPGPYPTADYRDYLRLFVPPGSELLSTSGFDEPGTDGAECGRAVFGGLVVVPPGQERRVAVTYRLPSSVQLVGYKLVIQKQPGSEPYTTHVRVGSDPEALQALDLSGSRTFALADGQLGSLAWSPAGSAGSVAACDVRNEPPRPLAPPKSLVIPSIEVRADFEELTVEPDGTLASPSNGAVIGWYLQSARPGQVGNFIVSGHLDWDKKLAVFWRLKELRPADRVDVVAEGGEQYTYEVEWIRQVAGRETDLRSIVGPTTQQWMTLITCGGEFDPQTHDYAERTIVRARLVGRDGGKPA